MNLDRLVNRPLLWTQPRMLREEYELKQGDESLGTLAFRSAWGSLATANNAAGCWTFKRLGFLQTRVTVRRCEAEEEVATFRNTTWPGGGTLELRDGRVYKAATNFWQTRFEIVDAAGQPVVRYQTESFLRMSGQMELLGPVAQHPELAWIMMLGWYLAVMMYRDSAMMASS